MDLVKNLQNNKIKIKVTKLKKGSLIYIGAIEKELFKSLNGKAPANWTSGMNGKIYYFNSQASTFGHANSQLKTFSENSNIEVSMSGSCMKIAMKKNSAEFNLLNNN